MGDGLLMRDWHLMYRSDEIYPTAYKLECIEVPWWARAVTEAIEFVDASLHHVFCNPPSWTWSVPMGIPKYDPSDASFIENSLGCKMADMFQALMRFEYRYVKTVIYIDMTEQQMVDNNQELDIAL